MDVSGVFELICVDCNDDLGLHEEAFFVQNHDGRKIWMCRADFERRGFADIRQLDIRPTEEYTE